MTNMFFQTEGTNADGGSYESAMCCPMDSDERRKFAHDLLDEFLAAFARDPKTERLSFSMCIDHDKDAAEAPVSEVVEVAS